MRRRVALLGLLLVTHASVWAQAPVTPTAEETRAEDRVGHLFWARPGLTDSSVDFYSDPQLRERAPVYKKARFRIREIFANNEGAQPVIVYRVRFDIEGEKFIALETFDKGLYRELAPNQVMRAPPNSPVGAAPHLWIFERSSIFASDPDIIWARIKNEGPRTFKRKK